MGFSRSPAEVAGRLAALTGDLSAPPDRSKDLERARRLIVHALLHAREADDGSPTSEETPSAELRLIAAEEMLAHERRRPARVVRRHTPATPLGATETLGPFVTPEMRRVWFDVFEAAGGTPSSVNAGAGPFLVFTGAIGSTGTLSYSVPAGGVWIRASSLVGGAASNLFVGLRVTGGRITFGSKPPSTSASEVVVGRETTFTVDLDLEAPARERFFRPPATVSIDFTGESAANVQPATARISANGAVVDLNPEGPATLAADGHLQFAGTVTTIADTASSSEHATHLSGNWKIDKARWLFGLETLDPQHPTLPNESGFGTLDAGPGLRLSWHGVDVPIPIDGATVIAHADHFEITARSTARGIRQTLRDNEEVLADIRFDLSSPVVVSRFEQDSVESRLSARASVQLSPRRPLAADGSPIAISSADAHYGLVESNGTASLSLGMTPNTMRTALALSNALLTVEGPSAANIECRLAANNTVAAARLSYRFALKGVLPTLPDPYVANFEATPQQGAAAQVRVIASWEGQDEPTVLIDVRERDQRPPILLSWMPSALDDRPNPFNSGTRRREVASSLGREGVGYWMLDVSTNAGQFGIAIGSRNERAEAAIENGQLQWNGLDALVFSVPAIQWEPVADSTGLMLSVDDGGPSAFAVDTVRLVPVMPSEAARLLVDAHRRDAAALGVSITLPFGIRAFVASDRSLERPPAAMPRPRVEWSEPIFDDLRSAPRLHIESRSDAGMPGFVTQTDNVVGGTNVLAFPAAAGAPVVSTMFNAAFNFQSFRVPLHRYDWSGFGAAAFSHWINLNQIPPTVSQVRFDVINGRTSHEVVQVSAILWPCQAFLVRTITLERQNNASVIRHDSGWIASSDGRFVYPGSLCPFHRGVVGGYVNIREIRDTPRIIDQGTARFQQVYFDADLEIDGILTGGHGKVAPVQRHAGYVQFLPISGNITPSDLQPSDLQELLRREGAVGGPVDCEIEIGAAGPRMLINKLQVDTAIRPPGAPEFAVSLNGMPRFPSSGAWTAVRTSAGQTTAVDGSRGVPLIREGAKACRFADPADLFRPLTPATQYGFLFSTNASRVLLPSPEVQAGDRVITSPFRARLADPYALAIAQGLFPKDAAALEFPSAFVADFAAPVILNQQAARRSGDLELVSNKVMRLYVEAPATFDAVVNAADWKVDSVPQTLFLDLLGFAKLLSVRGEWLTESSGARKFANPVLELSGAIEPVKDILELLKNLRLPVDIDFSLRTEGTGTLALEATMAGHLAEPDGSRIDTGMGKLGGSLRLGVVIRASISNGVQGYAYIEISGDLQQAIIPGLLYAGGHLRFRAGVFDNGDTQLEMTAGTVGSIGGDLIKGLIEVEGTVKYGYTLVVPNNNLEQIRMGVVLGMEVRAVLLSGLVGIKFGWEGGALMSLDPPKTHVVITAHVSASASVTAAWVFKARRSITVEYTAEVPRGVVLGVLAVTTFGVGPAAGAAALA